MLDDSWVIVGDNVDKIENHEDSIVGGDSTEQGEDWSGQRWCKFTSGEEMTKEFVSESNVNSNLWRGEAWRKYV